VRRGPSGTANLVARVITAAVGIPLVVGIDYLGGATFAAALGVSTAIGIAELYAMERKAGYAPYMLPGLLAGVALAVTPFFVPHVQDVWVGIMVAAAAVIGCLYLLPGPASGRAFLNWALTVAPLAYVGLLFGHLGLLREVHHGARWVALALVITWAYDSGAYITGRQLGRTPFMSHISPKKTQEGVLGGLLVATVAGFAAVPGLGLAIWQAPALGLLGGAVAQAGDLFESMIKRQTGVKDSGSIVPGHGGLLDRVDSLLFTGAFAYYAAILLGYGS
jgi:phosphatidate cytidylyltransferase